MAILIVIIFITSIVIMIGNQYSMIKKMDEIKKMILEIKDNKMN